MNILCLGGGPAGLYFSLLMKKQDPTHRVVVVERNRPTDTFGWGVVFSDQTLGNLAQADEPTAREILQSFNHWDDIDVHINGEVVTSGGHGFCGIGRMRLLQILQARCRELGVELVFETEAGDEEIAAQYDADLVIAGDGLNSRVRTRYQDTFQPDIEQRHCRFVWLGTKKKFDAFTFAFEQTEHGWFQAHAYQYDGDTSTFIVETPEEVGTSPASRTWTRRRRSRSASASSPSTSTATRCCPTPSTCAARRSGSVSPRDLPHLGARNEIGGKRVPVVLMGDAAHTAHFSIGSGTKLALETRSSCRATSRARHRGPGRGAGRLRGGAQRRGAQAAERGAQLDGMVRDGRALRALEPEQFAYTLLTRSQRISPREPAGARQGLRRALRAVVRAARVRAAGLQRRVAAAPCRRCCTPFKVRDVVLANRIVVSPMAQYSARGRAGDYHMVHLGARAMGAPASWSPR
jgi:anthraniloyl-CoA monooxygenase